MRPAGSTLALAAALALAAPSRAGETITYGYDELGRLTRVSNARTAGTATESAYSYDSADNRLTMTRAAASLPTVAGGGFEAPDLPAGGYAYTPAGGPATFAGQTGIAANNSAWSFASAPEGDQVAFLQNGTAKPSIKLQVTGLVPGLSYQASFRIAGRTGYLGMPVTVKFADSPIGTFTPTSYGFVAATTAAFTAAASSGTLEFEGILTGDNRVSGIDLVTVGAAN